MDTKSLLSKITSIIGRDTPDTLLMSVFDPLAKTNPELAQDLADFCREGEPATVVGRARQINITKANELLGPCYTTRWYWSYKKTASSKARVALYNKFSEGLIEPEVLIRMGKALAELLSNDIEKHTRDDFPDWLNLILTDWLYNLKENPRNSPHARARGARIHAEIAGYATTCDAHSMVQIQPSGEQMERAIRRSVKDRRRDLVVALNVLRACYAATAILVDIDGDKVHEGMSPDTPAMLGRDDNAGQIVRVGATLARHAGLADADRLAGAQGGSEGVLVGASLDGMLEGIVPMTRGLEVAFEMLSSTRWGEVLAVLDEAHHARGGRDVTEDGPVSSDAKASDPSTWPDALKAHLRRGIEAGLLASNSMAYSLGAVEAFRAVRPDGVAPGGVRFESVERAHRWPSWG